MKKTVRTRRGVEPAGRPARREVELGKESTNELVQTLSQRGNIAAARREVRGGGFIDGRRPRSFCALRFF